MLIYSCKSNYTRIGDKNANYFPYHLKAFEADSLYTIGEYQKCHKLLDSLFKKFEPANTSYLYEYGSYLMTSVITHDTLDIDKKIAFAYKKYGGMRAPIHPLDDYLKLKNYYSKDSMHYEKLRGEYLKTIDLDLNFRIQAMVDVDGKYRRNARTDEDWKKVEEIDDLNKLKIKDVIKNDVYPNYYVIGYPEDELGNFASVIVLLLHQDYETMQKYLPVVYKAVKEGKCNPQEYAFLYDKCVVVHGKGNERQKYNEFGVSDRGEVDSIVKRNRKAIGLPSVNYFNWKWKRE